MAVAIPFISLAMGAMSAASEHTAGKIKEEQMKTQASQEELVTKQREADRKERLIGALAVTNAQIGASGISSFGGSPLTVLEESIKAEERGTARDKFSSDLTAKSMRSRGRVAAKIGKQKAASTLIQSVSTNAPLIAS